MIFLIQFFQLINYYKLNNSNYIIIYSGFLYLSMTTVIPIAPWVSVVSYKVYPSSKQGWSTVASLRPGSNMW